MTDPSALHPLTASDALQSLRNAGIQGSLHGHPNAVFSGLAYDSREVGPGFCFVALRGAQSDGHTYIAQTVRAGASIVVVDEAYPTEDRNNLSSQTAVLQVPDTRHALAFLSALWFRHPDHSLKIVGVTGTNGKTSTCWLLSTLARNAGINVGMIGTMGAFYNGQHVPLVNTTPSSFVLYRLLRDMVDSGVEWVVMEVSSHALVHHRVEGLAVDVGVFTNLSQDHLNFHKTMEAYFDAKCALFRHTLPTSRRLAAKHVAAVLCAADPKSPTIAAICTQQSIPYATYSIDAPRAEDFPQAQALLHTTAHTLHRHGIEAQLNTGALSLSAPLLGRINLENLLCALAVARTLGCTLPSLLAHTPSLQPVPGRLQPASPTDVSTSHPVALVDYAHTPDAVRAALASLRPISPGRLWTVLGCGGDRDQTKRAPMGRAAAQGADCIVATSDNPRSEDPHVILQALEEGLLDGGSVARSSNPSAPTTHLIIPSRREAIAATIGLASPNDTVLVAGKGHETYQEVHGVRTPMSDLQELQHAMSHPSGRRVVETLTPADIARAVGALSPHQKSLDPLWHDHNAGVTTDSRAVREGSIFVALIGERFDAHNFLSQAVSQGACGLIVQGEEGARAAQQAWDAQKRSGWTLQVEDTLTALGDLAQAVLERWRTLRAQDAVVVAVTGSNGKTTTKEMVAALARFGAPGLAPQHVHTSQGNYNNFIGLPLSVFDLRWAHRVAILEMGMNAPGEIRRLAAIARPDIRMITCVARAHLEGLGSLEGVLRAKAEMFEVSQGHDLIFPASLRDDLGRVLPKSFADAHCVRFAVHGDCDDAQATVQHTASGWTIHSAARTQTLPLHTPLLGAHNATNAAAAMLAVERIAARLQLDLSSVDSVDLSSMERASGRLTVREGQGAFAGVHILDDAYNANPASMRAGLEVVRLEANQRNTRAWAVLGDMLELGNHSPSLHQELGDYAAELQLAGVVAFGLEAQEIEPGARKGGLERVAFLPNTEGAPQRVLDLLASWGLSQGDCVLIKGSRGVRLERVVTRMTTPPPTGDTKPNG